MIQLVQQVPFPFACQRWRERRGTYRPPNEVISNHDYEAAPIILLEAKALPHDEGGNTPAAALTAYAREEDRKQALAAGYQMYIAKPIGAGNSST